MESNENLEKLKQITKKLNEQDGFRDIKYKTLIELCPAVIVIMDNEGTIIEWNKYAEIAFKCTKNLAVGSNYFDNFLDDNWRPVVKSQKDKVLSENKIVTNFYNPVLTKDGSSKDLFWNASPIIFGEQKFFLKIGFDFDFFKSTDLKYKLSMFENINDFYYIITDVEGNIKHSNFYKEVKVNSIFELFDIDFSNNCKNSFDKLINHKFPSTSFYIKDKNFVYQVSCRMINSEILIGFIDISDFYNQRLDFIFFMGGVFEQINEIVVVTSTHGGLLYANTSFCSTFGYSQEEIKTLQITDLIPEDLREKHLKAFKEFVDFDKHKDILHLQRNVLGLKKDSSIVKLNINVIPIVISDYKIFVALCKLDEAV